MGFGTALVSCQVIANIHIELVRTMGGVRDYLTYHRKISLYLEDCQMKTIFLGQNDLLRLCRCFSAAGGFKLLSCDFLLFRLCFGLHQQHVSDVLTYLTLFLVVIFLSLSHSHDHSSLCIELKQYVLFCVRGMCWFSMGPSGLWSLVPQAVSCTTVLILVCDEGYYWAFFIETSHNPRPMLLDLFLPFASVFSAAILEE